jgi:hypothetical protein
MIRIVPFAVQSALVFLWAGSSLAQQQGTTGGQPPAKGQTPPAQTQPPATQGNQANQAIQGQPNTIQNPIHYGTMTQNPFFMNQGVQKQLNLNDPQMNQLKQNYGNYWNQYMKDLGAGQANKGKTNTGELTTNFNNQMLKTAQGVLSPTQFQRYRQLHWQAQGFNTFNDPTVIQQLNLSADQQAKIRAYSEQQNQKAGDIFGSSSADPQMAAKEYEKLRLQNDQYINSILTPQQQQTFRSLLGEPYDFTPNSGIKK